MKHQNRHHATLPRPSQGAAQPRQQIRCQVARYDQPEAIIWQCRQMLIVGQPCGRVRVAERQTDVGGGWCAGGRRLGRVESRELNLPHEPFVVLGFRVGPEHNPWQSIEVHDEGGKQLCRLKHHHFVVVGRVGLGRGRGRVVGHGATSRDVLNNGVVCIVRAKGTARRGLVTTRFAVKGGLWSDASPVVTECLFRDWVASSRLNPKPQQRIAATSIDLGVGKFLSDVQAIAEVPRVHLKWEVLLVRWDISVQGKV
mmetsp:Transcript_71276/g.168022  ORF Transcript_71276/g.168022 Transcript_71276/m.168022 type:complete len:255 (-) Transcript_71276:157-921(-)